MGRVPAQNLTSGSYSSQKTLWVAFDDDSVSISAEPPGREAWSYTLRWDDIVALKFQGQRALESDDVYIWTNLEGRSLVVPADCCGGSDFIDELITRGYFESEAFTEAMLTPYGSYIWPEELSQLPPNKY